MPACCCLYYNSLLFGEGEVLRRVTQHATETGRMGINTTVEFELQCSANGGAANGGAAHGLGACKWGTNCITGC
jgi:hypothetical protein